MPEQPDWVIWWGIGFVVLLSIGIIGTLIVTFLNVFRQEEEDELRRTHRRTREKP